MHINSSQLSTLNQMYALEEAAKSEAQREDDRTRRKLLIAAASSLPNEGDDCVVRLSGEDEGGPGAEAQGGETGDEQNSGEEASEEDGGEIISDYA
jgi:hypothetical protein